MHFGVQRKLLGTFRVWKNGIHSSHIYDGPFYEFNKLIPPLI